MPEASFREGAMPEVGFPRRRTPGGWMNRGKKEGRSRRAVGWARAIPLARTPTPLASPQECSEAAGGPQGRWRPAPEPRLAGQGLAQRLVVLGGEVDAVHPAGRRYLPGIEERDAQERGERPVVARQIGFPRTSARSFPEHLTLRGVGAPLYTPGPIRWGVDLGRLRVRVFLSRDPHV